MENEEYPLMTLDGFIEAMVSATANPDSVSVKGNLYGIRKVEWKLLHIDRTIAFDPALFRMMVEHRIGSALQMLYAVRGPEDQATARANGFVEGPEQQDPAFVAECKRRKAEAARYQAPPLTAPAR